MDINLTLKKNNNVWGFLRLFTQALFEKWLPGQQASVYTYHLDLKILPLCSGEKSQSLKRENPLLFHICLSKTTQKCEKHHLQALYGRICLFIYPNLICFIKTLLRNISHRYPRRSEILLMRL